MIYSDEKGDQLPGKEDAPVRMCCVEKRSAQKVFEEHGMKKKNARSRLQRADGDWVAPKGGRSGVRNEIEERLSTQRSTNANGGVLSLLTSAGGNWGTPIPGWGVWNQIEERQSRQRGLKSACPSGGALKEEELTAEWNRREWIEAEECWRATRSANHSGV